MDHQPYRRKHVGLVALGTLALLLLTAGIASAKESADWVTVNGPGLPGEVTVTDPALLASLGPVGIADHGNPLLTIASTDPHMPYSHVPYAVLLQREQFSAPPDAGPAYELTENFTDDLGQVSTFYVHYHPSITGGPGYIFSLGLVQDGLASSTGRWYPISPTAERAIQGILISEGVSFSTSAALAWAAIPTIGSLLGIGWLARRRRQPIMAWD